MVQAVSLALGDWIGGAPMPPPLALPAAAAARAVAPAGAGEARSTLHPSDPALADWFGGANTVPEIYVTPRTALRCPAVYAPIRLISGALSMMPLEFFERVGADRSRAVTSPIYDLVHARPNGWQTSAQFRKTMTERMLAWGNAYARIVNPGAPQALEPMHPERVWPYRTPDGRIWYRYTPRVGPVQTLAAFEVLHLRFGPAKDDEGLESESPLAINRETIAVAMACSEYLARFFANNAVPRGFIKVPSVLKEPAAHALRADWSRRYGGLGNAHTVGILDGGMSFEPMSMPNDEAQIIETYKTVSTEIASKIYGIPPHLAGDSERSTSWGTGIEQMNIGYVQHVLQPVMTEWEQTLDVSLLTASARAKYFFELSVGGLMRGDFKSRMEGYALMIQWGLATPNEVRRELNFPAVDNGDDRLQPLNMVPSQQAMAVLLKADPKPAARALRQLRGETPPDPDPAQETATDD